MPHYGSARARGHAELTVQGPFGGMLSAMVEYSHTSPHHAIRVADYNGVRTLRFERNQQSSMRLDDPFDTDIEHVGYLHLAVAVRPRPERALVIGLGGGTLAKQLWRDHPQLRIDAVEIDSEVVDVAREFFGLPDDPRICVYVSEGRSFLDASIDAYDMIFVDAYEDDRMPPQVTTEEFMRLARARLGADGVIAYNVIGSISGMLSKPLRRLHKTAGNVWGRVWVFNVTSPAPGLTGPENVILLASDVDLAEDELLARIADRVGGTVRVPGFDRFGDHLHRGKLRTGDVAILTDPRRRT